VARVWWGGGGWGGGGGVEWRGWRGVAQVARVGCGVDGWGAWGGLTYVGDGTVDEMECEAWMLAHLRHCPTGKFSWISNRLKTLQFDSHR